MVLEAAKKEKVGTGATTMTTKKIKRTSLKSPFELNKEQKKLIRSNKPKAKIGGTHATVTEKKKVKPKTSLKNKDKVAQLRAVQDERKVKDAKLKALSNRIAWLQSEEERASLKVGELNNLIHTAEEKSGVTAEDVKFKTALTKGKDEVSRSKQNVRLARKEHKRNLKVVLPKASKTLRKEEGSKGREKTLKKKEEEATVQEEVAEAIQMKTVSRLQAKRAELENYDHQAQSRSLTALELITQRWQGSKQPLRENMEITRKQILSHNHRNHSTLAKKNSRDDDTYSGITDSIKFFEYSSGAWKKPLVASLAS